MSVCLCKSGPPECIVVNLWTVLLCDNLKQLTYKITLIWQMHEEQQNWMVSVKISPNLVKNNTWIIWIVWITWRSVLLFNFLNFLSDIAFLYRQDLRAPFLTENQKHSRWCLDLYYRYATVFWSAGFRAVYLKH